jgi:hypothetical protein
MPDKMPGDPLPKQTGSQDKTAPMPGKGAEPVGKDPSKGMPDKK